jgi:hypothetical protein
MTWEKIKIYLHKRFGWFVCEWYWKEVDRVIATEPDESGGWWETIYGHCKYCSRQWKTRTTACPHTSNTGFAPAYLNRCFDKHTKEEAINFQIKHKLI